MASLSKRASSGSYSIQFEDRHRVRKTITLGRVPKRTAQQTLIHVERLVAAQIAGTAPDADTSRWLASASEKLTAKLAKVGLIQERQSATLGGFIDHYEASRVASGKIKASTMAASKPAFKNLRKHFGTSFPLRSISKGQAKAWRDTIAKGRAENTVRKWTAVAKKLFNAAIELELVNSNPFVGLPATIVEVRERDYFVTRQEAAKVLESCPSLEWRLIFGLARFGGLRCPSEVLALQWGDVLWDKRRFVVRSEKTAHHEGKETRIVPLFPEVEALLSEAFDAAEPGAEYVVNKTRDSAANLRTTMTKIVERAGLKPWPKLFQNLRSTRATELADKYPGHVAAAWLGHSEKVAKGHYWQVTDDHFDTAATEAPKGDQALQNALQKVLAGSCNELLPEQQTTGIADSSALLQVLSTCIVGDEGLEPPTSSV